MQKRLLIALICLTAISVFSPALSRAANKKSSQSGNPGQGLSAKNLGWLGYARSCAGIPVPCARATHVLRRVAS